MDSLEKSLRQIETQSLLLLNDSSIKSYSTSLQFPEYVDHLLLRKTIEDKLTVHNEVNNMIYNLTLYFPTLHESISSKKLVTLSEEQLIEAPKNKWFQHIQDDRFSFRLIFTNPTFPSEDFNNVTSAVETSVSLEYMKSVLQTMDLSGNGTSFFYFEGMPLISNHQNDYNFLPMLKSAKMLERQETQGSGPLRNSMKIDGVSYLIQTIYSPSLQGTLISYVKLSDFLSPLQKMNRLVNVSLFLLFLTGLTFVYFIYRHFRMPFSYLVKKLEQLGSGNVNSRAVLKVNNEFDFLFDRFNEMASRIKALIENVYEERVRAREAEYKHLQSQINPHFLYNSLFYIVSMAHKSPDAVISMAKNLSHFYRYITRKVGFEVTLADEIQLVESYLEVQSLRNKHLSYEIHIPAPMLELPVPTLLLQPVIENAIVHGLERKRFSGKILINGVSIDKQYILTVDDDGAGMSPLELEELKRCVYNPPSSSESSANEMSCGLLNIHQRLVNRYGNKSGVAFSNNDWGGLKVTLTISEEKTVKTNERIIGG
ncbi:sensor histidine kinase [Paenibacillus plantarum]|nr:histidine kinase [Paenibacillus plantarum]